MSYKIHFDANGGSLADPADITSEDGFFIFPSVNPRKGYEIKGFSINESGSPLFTADDMPISSDITLYAVWEPITLTITFLNEDKTTLKVLYKKYNEKLQDSEIPEAKDIIGKVFDDWYADSRFSIPLDRSAFIHENVTYYPRYITKLVKVTFVEPTGHVRSITIDVKYKDILIPPKFDPWDGYSLGGYYLDEAFTTAWNFKDPVLKPMTLYLKYIRNYYTIDFVDIDGTKLSKSLVVEHGGVAVKPTDPSKESYVFNYWTLDGKKYEFGNPVTQNMTLVANWQEIYFKVRFFNVYNVEIAQTGISPQDVRYGNTATIPANYEELGSTFVCWSTTRSEKDKYDFSAPVKANLKLYAIMKTNVVTVYYNDGEELIDAKEIAVGSYAQILAPTPTKKNYLFVSWTNKDGSVFDFTKPILKDTYLYALWDSVYTCVVFNTCGGEVINPIKVAVGKSVTEPKVPTKAGHTFIGWYADAAMTKEFNFLSIIEQMTTIYAKWSTNYYTVTFVYGNHSTDQLTQRVMYGYYAKQPDTPYRAGYTFQYWANSAGEKFTFSFTTITKDITLTAVWKQKDLSYSGSFLAMVNSEEYYLGKDVTAAIELMLSQPIKEIDFKLYTGGKSSVDDANAENDIATQDSIDETMQDSVDEETYIRHGYSEGYIGTRNTSTKDTIDESTSDIETDYDEDIDTQSVSNMIAVYSDEDASDDSNDTTKETPIVYAGDSAVSGLTVEQFYAIYNWCIGKTFDATSSYMFTFDEHSLTMQYYVKETKYAVPMTGNQISSVVQMSNGISLLTTTRQEIVSYLSNFKDKFPVYYDA